MVVAGAGQGGLQAAESLRLEGWEGEIILFGEERIAPYYRPPLSKEALLEPLDLSSIVLRGPEALVDKGIDFRPNTRVTAVDRAKREVTLANGTRQPYEGLVIATGGVNRRLPVPNGDHPDIVSIRGVDDAHKFAVSLAEAETVVVVGAGFVGMEIAACCRLNDKVVTVVERESRVLARAVSPLISDTYARLHRERGVHLALESTVAEVIVAGGKVKGVKLTDGRVIEADLIVAGIGLVPADELGRGCGLPCDHGIIVDRCSRTIDPHIVAIGDCTATAHEPGMPLHRLESVQNALEQAKSGAAALMGREKPFLLAPWFWSDQYEIKLQMVGTSLDHDRVVTRGDIEGYKFSAFYFKGEQFLGTASLNRVADHMASRKILDRGLTLTPEQAADETLNINSIVKAAEAAEKALANA
ncbi:pyridine nucleotide-disulfide oxidoreductase [Siculibacillus lacustris]|uniref:Pyridine nucleotide-disulfide oxidoreductase n=2 Tax=Siculibacillus lacustris TaxID=1549641 RepID=A0A4Q9VRD3_9HYPH|nr:pyridine nucleotide-disulfide oxidoreductase [Siculibacillus lacustris]